MSFHYSFWVIKRDSPYVKNGCKLRKNGERERERETFGDDLACPDLEGTAAGEYCPSRGN